MICTGISSTVDPGLTGTVVGCVKRKALIRVSLVEDLIDGAKNLKKSLEASTKLEVSSQISYLP